MLALPFIGLFTYLLGGALAVGASRLLDLEGRKTGALFGCGFFTNIGAIGTLVCYIFLGEAGFALVAIFKLFQEVAYYGIGFPVAKYFGSSRHDVPARGLLKHLVRDPYLLVAVSAVSLRRAAQYQRRSKAGILQNHYIRFCAALNHFIAHIHRDGHEIS